jgi:hypothetical protein
MTIEELHNHLIQNSPFKFKGDSIDLFYFSKDNYSINGGERYKYTLSKVDNNFIFNDGGLIPLFQNVKIEIQEKEVYTVLLNLNVQSLKNYPERSKDAENGYLILQPFK